MTPTSRAARRLLLGVAVFLILVVVGVIVLNGTYYGRERFRQLALDAVQDIVNGEINVGRVEGQLLDRFDLVDVSILDEDGRPFLVADRVRVRVALAPLVSRRIVVRSLELVHPVVTLTRDADGPWNYQTIFDTGDTLSPARSPGFGSWVDLRGITILNGTLLVDQPYPSDEAVRRTVGDSAAYALARDTRIRVERVGGSLRQTMEFRDINARIPRLIAADPDSTAIAFRVRQLSMLATPLDAPDVVVRDMEGDVRIVEDTVSLRDMDVRLPESRFEGALTYHVSAGDLALDLRSDTVTFADIQILHPSLPERGGGRLDLKATIRDTATSEYEVTNARLAVGDSRVTGRIGMAVNPDMLELRETDLRFTRFTTALVESLVPGLRAKVPGAFTGRARLSGPADAMNTDVSGTYDPLQHPSFLVSARGVIGTGEVTSARNLRVNIRGLPVSLAREFVDEVPIGGTADLDAVISGTSASRFGGRATITHREAATSILVAEGSISPRDSMRMDLALRFEPVSLELAERFAPETDFRGAVRGTGEIRGTLRELRATLALQLPSGTARLDGTFDLQSPTRTYQASTDLRDVDLHAMAASMPVTSLSGTATVVGQGTTTRTVEARATLHLRDAMVDSTPVTEAVIVAAARDARLTVDTLRVQTPFAVATAQGALGLVEGTEGTLNYQVDVRTLSGLERWIAIGDTTVVNPRPLAGMRAARVFRGDSVRTDPLSDSSLAAVLARRQDPSRPVPQPGVQAAPGIGRDSIAGSAIVRGTLEGAVQRLTAQGTADLDHVIWGGSEIGRGSVDFTWVDVGTPEAALTTTAGVDSLRVAGFALDSTHVEATYRNRTGDVTLQIFPGDTALYRLQARYAFHPDHGEVHLQEVNLRFDSVTWRSVRPSTVRWQGGGLSVDSLDLRSGDGTGRGRIFVHGEVPDRDPGRLTVRIDSLRVAPWLTLLQSDLALDGIGSFQADIEGTRANPRITGSIGLRQHVYRNVPFPEVHSTFTYADRRLQFEGDLRRDIATAPPLAHITGSIPIDLSLADSVVTRTLAGTITIDVEGDSIPLGPLTELVEEFTVVNGAARGRIGIRGTWEQLDYEGALDINVPQLGLRTPGVTLARTVGSLHMADDRLVIDSLVGYSGGPIRVTGSMLLADMSRPVLDVRIVADEARAMDNEKGQLVVSSRLDLKGPLDTVSIGGSLTVMHGVIRIPDPEELNLISTGDPTLFAIADTALARELEIEPPSPILKNANVDVRFQVRRGTWARNREANIEVYGDLAIERATGDQEIQVTGALHSDYGDYELYGRRFSVTRGSVRFTGPASNPVLQLLATHEVRQAGGAPFDIQVTIGGTLERPNISLESQANPTLTQSDLISFLAFGQSSTSLLAFEGSSLEGGGLSGSSLTGTVSALATRQLAGVALDALLVELEADLAERTAADVLRIRPAELPPGLSLGDVGTLARGTQIEVGKYLDRNTFFVGKFRPTFAVPGATLERRFGTQFRVRTSLETRYLPLRPSLTSGLQPTQFQVLAAMLLWTRSW